MSIKSIERGLEREEEILQEQLSSGVITVEEYNKELRHLYRDAREYAREEAEQEYENYSYHG